MIQALLHLCNPSYHTTLGWHLITLFFLIIFLFQLLRLKKFPIPFLRMYYMCLNIQSLPFSPSWTFESTNLILYILGVFGLLCASMLVWRHPQLYLGSCVTNHDQVHHNALILGFFFKISSCHHQLKIANSHFHYSIVLILPGFIVIWGHFYCSCQWKVLLPGAICLLHLSLKTL